MRLSNLGTGAVWVAAIVCAATGALRAENDKVTKFRNNEVISGKVNKA